MPNFWFFSSPYLCYGDGALTFLENVPGQKCFIVTDKGIIKAGLIDPITKMLKKFNRSWQVFDDIEPDPSEETVFRGVAKCQEWNPDLIIGLGGGSCMDAAKAMWVLYERPDLKLDDINPFCALTLGKKAKMLAIPTTSGTGAEVTWAVIITRKLSDGSGLKIELANRAVIPNYAIVDPTFTVKLPPMITVATGFDAITHCIEGYLSLWHNDFSDGFALQSLRISRQYLPQILKDPTNISIREKLHNAASMAGLAFGNSQVTIAHALGHAVGAIFHIPHGLSVGVFVPYLLQYVTQDPKNAPIRSRVADLARILGVADWHDDESVAIVKIIQDLINFQQICNFPRNLRELKVTRQQLDENLNVIVMKSLESLGSVLVPRPINRDLLGKILLYAWDGKDIDF